MKWADRDRADGTLRTQKVRGNGVGQLIHSITHVNLVRREINIPTTTHSIGPANELFGSFGYVERLTAVASADHLRQIIALASERLALTLCSRESGSQ